VNKTPNQNWIEKISAYKKKCQCILDISSSIRYVGLINQYGRTMTGIIKPGTNILLKSESARNEFFLVSALFNMRNKIDTAIGTMDYAIFKHDKVTLFVLQSKEGIYYVSLNGNVAPDVTVKIISKIKKII
jgi:predicted transcriptional regulator